VVKLYEDDLVDEKPKEVEIDGRKFKLHRFLGYEIDTINSECMHIADDGKMDLDMAKRNKMMLEQGVLDAPYTKSNKAYSELQPHERADILRRLNPTIRAKILSEIHKIHFISEEDKKKSTSTSTEEDVKIKS